jgi:hypothetical protein
MTIKSPPQYGAQLTNDWLGLSEIKALEWGDLLAAGHLVYARLVSEMGGHVFEPPWETGGTFTRYASDSDARGLDEIGLGGFAERVVAGGDVKMAIIGIVEDVTFDYTVTNLATSTQLTSATVTRGSFGVISDIITLTRSNVVDAQGRPQHLDIDVQAGADTDGNTAKIWQLRAGELELTSTSDLPTG